MSGGDYRHIVYEERERFARLTLNRPQALNAIDPIMMDEIARATQVAEANASVNALVVTGAGERAFCAGMDLKAFQERAAGFTPLQMRGARSRSHPLSQMTKPVIAAVNGLAYGGGLELVLLCDLVVAASHSSFAAAEVTRGLIPGNGATQRLPRKIGLTRAMEMLLTGQPIDAQNALRIGLVNDVVPSSDLLSAAESMAAAIGANGPLAVRAAKEATLRGADLPLDEGLQVESDLLTLVQGTGDAREGVRAFLEKRKPNFTGR